MEALNGQIYRPLNEGEVRLLRIEPATNLGDTECQIDCTFETVSINAMPEYIALPYVSLKFS